MQQRALFFLFNLFLSFFLLFCFALIKFVWNTLSHLELSVSFFPMISGVLFIYLFIYCCYCPFLGNWCVLLEALCCLAFSYFWCPYVDMCTFGMSLLILQSSNRGMEKSGHVLSVCRGKLYIQDELPVMTGAWNIWGWILGTHRGEHKWWQGFLATAMMMLAYWH